MDSRTSAIDLLSYQPLRWKASSAAETDTSTDSAEKSSEESSSADDFSALLNSFLAPDAEKNVSEEALFAALTVERVTKLKGEEIGKKYGDLLKSTEQSMTKNGYVPHEDAARIALKQMVASGDLTAEEGDTINTHAFSAAQLDTNLSCLYDHIGGGTDVTKAVAVVESAISGAKAALEKIDSGEDTPASRPLSSAFDAAGNPVVNPYSSGVTIGTAGTTVSTGSLPTGAHSPNGTVMDGNESFLFKPVSDGDGKLAVMIPSTWTEWADSVVLKDSSGNVLEEGYWWPGHVPEAGEVGPQRRKFSFDKPGGMYPDNLTVEVRYNNGETATYSIPDPAKRYD